MSFEIVCVAAVVAIIFLFIIGYIAEESKKNQIVCPNPNCGFQGKGKEDGGSSGCLLIILLLLGILPGILYLLFSGKKGLICPKCGCRIR